MQPGSNPLHQLAAAIERLTHMPGSGDHIRQNGLSKPQALHEQIQTLLSDDPTQRFVLLVDQFEEIFTQTKDDATKNAFIHLLTNAAQTEGGRNIIVLALRSDFISNCASYPELRTLMSQQFQLVGAMEATDLTKAITLPALEVGIEIDPALVSRIMADMKGEPGALPLMSFALLDLFEAKIKKRGEHVTLTLSDYLQRGGIERAIEKHADKVFAQFSERQRLLARYIFSRLINVGEKENTRRIVTLDELLPKEEQRKEVEAIIHRLASGKVRLLTIDSRDHNEVGTSAPTTITLTHEKLIEAWPWLRQLVDENREIIALQNQIDKDARAWVNDKDSSFLYQGVRLLQIEERLETLNLTLDILSQEFIQVSREKQLAKQEADKLAAQEKLKQAQMLFEEQKARADSEAAARKRISQFVIALCGLLLISISATLSAFRQVAVVDVNRLITASQGAYIAGDYHLATLLALEANKTLKTDEADELLRTLPYSAPPIGQAIQTSQFVDTKFSTSIHPL